MSEQFVNLCEVTVEVGELQLVEKFVEGVGAGGEGVQHFCLDGKWYFAEEELCLVADGFQSANGFFVLACVLVDQLVYGDAPLFVWACLLEE